MKKLPLSRPLPGLLVIIGLCAGAPALAAGSLGQFTTDLVAPADITGGVLFGKNGEVIPLDAAGTPQAPCRLPQATPVKGDTLAACRSEAVTPSAEATPATAGGVPCSGYYLIYVGGYPVKVWYPTGCTPP